METEKKLAVIIPVADASGLARTLGSLSVQSSRGFRTIVVSEKDIPEVSEVVQDFEDSIGAELRILPPEGDSCLEKSALSLLKDEIFVQFLYSGDELSKNAIQAALKQISGKSNKNVYHYNTNVTNNDRRLIIKEKRFPGKLSVKKFVRRVFLKGATVPASSFVFLRSALLKEMKILSDGSFSAVETAIAMIGEEGLGTFFFPKLFVRPSDRSPRRALETIRWCFDFFEDGDDEEDDGPLSYSEWRKVYARFAAGLYPELSEKEVKELCYSFKPFEGTFRRMKGSKEIKKRLKEREAAIREKV